MKKSARKRIEDVLHYHLDDANIKVTKGMIRAAKKKYNKLTPVQKKTVGYS